MFLTDNQVSLGSSLYWPCECLSGGVLGISNSQFCSGSEAWEASVTKAPAVSKWFKNNGKIHFSKDIRSYFYFVETFCTGTKQRNSPNTNMLILGI